MGFGVALKRFAGWENALGGTAMAFDKAPKS